MTSQLSDPFPPEQIRQREGPGGRMLEYAPVHAVIAQANAVFGPDWSYQVTSGPHVVEGGCWATVRVTAAGQSREDCGFTQGQGEMAIKGCVSDAIKRALRSYGPALGLMIGHGENGSAAASNGETLFSSDGLPLGRWKKVGDAYAIAVSPRHDPIPAGERVFVVSQSGQSAAVRVGELLERTRRAAIYERAAC